MTTRVKVLLTLLVATVPLWAAVRAYERHADAELRAHFERTMAPLHLRRQISRPLSVCPYDPINPQGCQKVT